MSVGNANQPFLRLLEAVARLAEKLPPPVIIQHGHTQIKAGNYQMVDFLSMDQFVNLVKTSDLLILHAGAGSILNALAARNKPVVVPRRVEFGEHINNHQVEFAGMLAKSGRIFLAEDTKYLDKTVDEALCWSRTEKIKDRTTTLTPLQSRMIDLVRDALSGQNKLLSR